jgi:hypothetical protein
MARPPTYQVVLLRPELSILWFTLPMVAFGLLLLLSGWSLLFGLLFTWCGAVLSFRFGRGKSKPTRVPGKLTIDAGGIALDGASIAARRSLRGGLLVPTSDDLIGYAEIRGVGADGFKLAKKGLILEHGADHRRGALAHRRGSQGREGRPRRRGGGARRAPRRCGQGAPPRRGGGDGGAGSARCARGERRGSDEERLSRALSLLTRE